MTGGFDQAGPGALDGIELVATLPAARRAELVRLCQWRRYDKDEQIIDRQSVSRDVLFIVNGRVRVVIYSLAGRELALDDRPSGTFLGELAALDGQPRSASVMAVVPTQVAALPAEQFLRLLAVEPDFALVVMRRLAAMVRATTERVIDLSTLGANHRVHVELLRLALAAARDRAGVPAIRPIPIHGDLAARVSTTRETVARVLNDLARRGIVVRGREELLVPGLTRLQEMVEDVRGE